MDAEPRAGPGSWDEVLTHTVSLPSLYPGPTPFFPARAAPRIKCSCELFCFVLFLKKACFMCTLKIMLCFFF